MRGVGQNQKKNFSQKKIRKKKIFPGIVPKKKFIPWKIQSCQVSRSTQKGKKAARFVVQIKEVVPISPKNWVILAINSSGKFFLTPKMVNWPKISSIGVKKKKILPLRKSPPPHHFSNGPSLTKYYSPPTGHPYHVQPRGNICKHRGNWSRQVSNLATWEV